MATAFSFVRQVRAIKQKDLAARLGVSTGFVNDMEHGRRSPGPALADRVLSELRANPEEAESMIREWAGEWMDVFEKWALRGPILKT